MSVPTHVTPRFTQTNQSRENFNELRKLVNAKVASLPVQRHKIAVIKAFLLPVMFLAIYGLALNTTNYLFFCLAYALLGFTVVIMFLNIIHEVCHETLFRSKKMNRAFLVLFDLLGANSYMWKRRHTRLHHHFPNVAGWDSDIEKSKFLKVHPKEDKKIFSRNQELMLLLYPFFIINWFFIRDFQDFFGSKTIVSKLGKIPRVEYFKLFFFKFLCMGYLVVIPAMVTPFSLGQTLIAELILLLSCGFFALLVLLPPHVNTSNQFPVVNENNQLEHSWLLHQLNTTNDVNGNNWFVTHVLGNFNLHLAHHLFPDISYVYAKEVTNTIRKFSLKKGLPYRSYPLLTTLVEHYRVIKTNRSDFNIMQEDM